MTQLYLCPVCHAITTAHRVDGEHAVMYCSGGGAHAVIDNAPCESPEPTRVGLGLLCIDWRAFTHAIAVDAHYSTPR